MEKLNLRGKTLTELEEFVASIDEPKYRAAQIYQWLYKFRAVSFDEMTNLSAALRNKLSECACIEKFSIVSLQTSALDGTKKFLFELSDGKRIETVLIPPRKSAVDVEERLTICVSTQVGCPLDCKFCATASMGFIRNLTASEILTQIFTAEKFSERPVTNIVFMGMGEPLLNYENVMKGVDIISDQTGIGISPRRITISTAGYANFIRRMADEQKNVKLALSLHSLRDVVRTELMPINKKFSVAEIIDAMEYYQKKTNKRIMLEYIVFEGVNDGEQDALTLAKTARRLECRVNLIPFHSIAFVNPQGISATLRGATRDGINRFWEKLREQNVMAFVRHSAGVDIDAACGQLAVNNKLTHEAVTE